MKQKQKQKQKIYPKTLIKNIDHSLSQNYGQSIFITASDQKSVNIQAPVTLNPSVFQVNFETHFLAFLCHSHLQSLILSPTNRCIRN